MTAIPTPREARSFYEHVNETYGERLERFKSFVQTHDLNDHSSFTLYTEDGFEEPTIVQEYLDYLDRFCLED